MVYFQGIIAAIVIILAFIYYRKKRKDENIRKKFASQQIQYVVTPNFLVQVAKEVRTELYEYDQVQKYGKVYGTVLLSSPTIFLCEPELIQLIMSKEFTNFTNRRRIEIDDPIFGSFLSTVEGEKWKRIRSVVTPQFSTGKLKRMKPRLDDTIDTLMANFESNLKEKPELDVKEIFGAYTMDTILQIAFGSKVDSLKDTNNKIVLMAKKLFQTDISYAAMLFFLLLFMFPKLSIKIARLFNINQDFIKFFKEFSMEIIRKKRDELKDSKNMGKANNFLEMMLEAEAEHEQIQENEKEMKNENMENDQNKNTKFTKFMTNDEIISQCILFFLAAYDTTTSAISLSCYLLALNQSAQDRLYEEIEAYFNRLQLESDGTETDQSKLMTFESMSQLEYLNAVINETLRIYPPAPVERMASKDMLLKTEDGSHRLNVKKDDVIHIPVYALHRDERYFPDPETFKPERFIGNPEYHKYAYLPFGTGPRNCVAKSLALYEVKMALINTIYRYRLSVCEQTHIPMKFFNNGQILSPKDVVLRMDKRQ
ncbi:Cytochrome P450 3A4 [Blomia tropicalis]|nr:Cytochrome P450 3A4 [Blomia tropicalis]